MPTLTLHIPDPDLRALIQDAVEITQPDVSFVDAPDTADITLTPPVRLGMVLDRIEAALCAKRARPHAPLPLSKDVTLHAVQRQLTLEGDTHMIALTDTETDILLALKSADAPLNRQRLMTDILGYHAEAETHTVETHIYRLRQKLEPHNATRELIITDKQGYSLNG